MTTEVQLTKGFTTIIDDCDKDLNMHKWHVSGQRNYAGRFVGGAKDRVFVYMHRLILSRMLGRELQKNEICDHINGDCLDNRRSNLRVASPQQNIWNSKLNSKNTSGYKGVSRHKGKWAARIKTQKKSKHLGLFEKPEDAYEAYCKAARQLFGEYANLGDPNDVSS